MLYCSCECGSISIMQLRTIYCNTHVYTFHVCLCLLALTFACNSTYLLKLEVQRYDSKQHDALKALSHVAIFLAICNAITTNHIFELLINTTMLFDIFEMSISINKWNYKQM